MLQKISYALFVAMLFFTACQKDGMITPQSASGESLQPSSRSSLSNVEPSKGWYGLYRYYQESGDPDWQGDTLFDYDLIKNGVAFFNDYELSLPFITGSSINYAIPVSHTISADSVAFEATVESASNRVDLQIFGVPSYKVAYLVIDTPVNGKRTLDLEIGGSSKIITVKTGLDLSSFHVIQLALRGTTALVYVNGKLIMQMPFTKEDRLGTVSSLKMQNLWGKIECDKVRLLNSYTRKVTMKEDFNIDGESHTIFY